MAAQERHTALFDLYVLGTISKEEEKEMHLLIKENPALKLEFESHKLLVDGIKLARKEELKDYLKEHGKVEYFQNIWGKKWRSASAIIVLLFTASFFAVQYLSKRANTEMAHKDDFKKEKKLEQKESKNKEVVANKPQEQDESPTEELDIEESKSLKNTEKFKKEFEILDEITYENEDIILAEADFYEKENRGAPSKLKERYKNDKAPETENAELPIVEEKKLFDTALVVVSNRKTSTSYFRNEKTSTQMVSKSNKKAPKGLENKKKAENKDVLDQETVLVDDKEDDKLESFKDTIATVQEPKTKPIIINIEIWKSPINFKGYQYQSKLKVYGVNKESILIIKHQEQLYLKINNKYCKIIKSSQYLPYNYITDITLIELLDGY